MRFAKIKFMCLLLLCCIALPPCVVRADCPIHPIAPAGVDPNPEPPTTPNDCDDDGNTDTPPLNTQSSLGSSPQPEPPIFGSGASCPGGPYPPSPSECPDDPRLPLPPGCPPPSRLPLPPECPNTQASPDSLPTIGEQVRLHVVAGGGAVPVRWGKTIRFGDGFRLNYLSYFQLTTDGLYARLYDPAGQAAHNFRTDPDAPTSLIETVAIDGETFTAHQYSDCYLGKTTDMNKVTIRTYTRSGEKRPARIEFIYPDGGSLHYESDNDEPIIGDLAGPLYRIVKRATREGYAITFTYDDDRLIIRDASGNEYVCHLNADNHIVKIAITAGDETRTWSYTYTTSKIIEKNDQTGLKVEMRGGNFITDAIVISQAGPSQSSIYTRDAKGNLLSMHVRGDTRSYTVATLPDGNTRHVETRDGRKITREYGAAGLLWRENSLGEREDFSYDEAKRLTYYKNALGHEWRYEYSSPGRTGVLLCAIAPGGGETRYEYLVGTDLISEKRVKTADGIWKAISYSYDSGRRLIRETRQLEGEHVSETRYVRRPDGRVSHVLEKVDDSRWSAIYYEHDSLDRVILIKGPYYVSDPDNPDVGRPAAGRSYAYDAWGNRTSDTDELGNVTRYEYDAGNRLVAIVNPLSQRTEYAYDGFGQRIRQTDALGNKTEWIYSSVGRITSIQGSSGVAGCNTCALAAGTTDKPGTYAWSSSGLLLTFTDLEGKITKYEYDAARRKSKETDPLGNITLFGYDAAGNLVSVTDPLGNVTQYAYDAAGRRISTTDPLGNVSGVAYDLSGRLVGSYDAAGGEQLSNHNTQGWLLSSKAKVDASTWRETRYSYNLRGNLTGKTDAYGSADAVVTRFEYDAAGRLVKTTIDPDDLAIVTETIYDAAGRMVEMRDGNGNATLFSHDAAGNLLSQTSPEGRKTSFEYDEVGRRIATVLDPEGIEQTRYVDYDAAGRVISESDGVAARSYVYDKLGRPTKILTPGQTDMSLIYNAAGQLLEARRLNTNGTVAMTAKREYDKAGRLIKTVDEAGKITLYGYDAAGRLVKTTNPLGAETAYEYDAAGRRTKIIAPHGGERKYVYNLAGDLMRTEGGAEGTVQYRYDALGRQTETVDANNRSRKTAYDLAGRTVRVENEMGQPVVYTHDAAGNQLTLTDANNNTTLFTYDSDGNLTAMTYPSIVGQPENIEQYQYDAADRLACKITPNGDHIRTLYDPAGNIAALYHGAEVEDVGAIPADRLIAKYERNGVGEVTKEEDPLTAMLYSFDSFGRLVEARDRTLEKSVRYAYDTRSLRSKMEVVDYASPQTGAVSMSVAYGYDDAGRLATVKKDDDPTAVYEYDLAGRRTKLTLPNNVSTEYTYDNADRLLDLTTRKDETVLAKFAYILDPTGNRTGITYADGSKSVYEFDGAYRLTRDKRVDTNNQTLYDEAYTYDSVGNRSTKVRTRWEPVDIVYQYNTRNQLVSLSSDDGIMQYTYDANGSLLSVSKESGTDSIYYDILDRMVKYIGNVGMEEYTYQGASANKRTITKITPHDVESTIIAIVYDNDNVVADFSGPDWILRNLHVSPGLDHYISIARMTGTQQGTYYYIQDALGSVRLLTNQQGTVNNTYDYTAFGVPFNSTAVLEQPYGFTGREYMATLGVMNNRHRNYEPETGIFDRRDPLGYHVNHHGGLYRYANANPVMHTDPYGLMTLAELCSMKGSFNILSLIRSFLDGGYTGDPELMAILNEIRRRKDIGDPDWLQNGIWDLQDFQKRSCPNGLIDLPHQFRNIFQECPEQEPKCDPDNWAPEGKNPFHKPNQCYRGLGSLMGNQCCYFGGILDDYSPSMGTWDYAAPSPTGIQRHFALDVLTHMNEGRYAGGLTKVLPAILYRVSR